MISSNYKNIISTLFITLITLTPCSLNAQNDNVKKHPNYQSFNLSYVIGGQVYNDNFLYNPGYSVKASFGKEINSDIAAGVGVGYMPLTKETFIPLYVELLGRKKKKDNTPFISFQGGYSIGWSSLASSNQQYDLDGGLFINAGLGRRIKINERATLLFHWSYSHQFAEMKYEIFGGKEHSETLNFDMIQISIGILLNEL